MNTKTYRKLVHVNYDSQSAVNTAQTAAADFSEYQVPLSQLHHLALHRAGVASGLELAASDDKTELRVAPGVAVDRHGHLIVLATGGKAVFAETREEAALPQAERESPVTIPVAAQAGKKTILITIQFYEKLGWPPSGAGNFPAGKLEQVPWLRLIPAEGFQDSEELVILGTAEITADGKIDSLTTMPAGGVAVSQGSGKWVQTTPNDFSDVSNLSVQLVTSGRPVLLSLVPDPPKPSTPSPINAGPISSIITEGGALLFRMLRDGQEIYRVGAGHTQSTEWINPFFQALDVPPPGIHSYRFQAVAPAYPGIQQPAKISHVRLMAFEL